MRVEQLTERFGDRITVEWRSFLLRPEMKERDQAKFVAYTESWRRPAEAEPSITFSQWATTASAPTGSLPAQVAAKAVAEYAPQQWSSFNRALMQAYFTDNRTISDLDVLAEVAVECGIDGIGLRALIETDERRLVTAVVDEHNSAAEAGITAVPTVVLDDVLPVQGAQDLASYELWINRLLERRTSRPA